MQCFDILLPICVAVYGASGLLVTGAIYKIELLPQISLTIFSQNLTNIVVRLNVPNITVSCGQDRGGTEPATDGNSIMPCNSRALRASD